MTQTLTVVPVHPGFEVGVLNKEEIAAVSYWAPVVAWLVDYDRHHGEIAVHCRPITMPPLGGDDYWIIKDPAGRITDPGMYHCESFEEWVACVERDAAGPGTMVTIRRAAE